MSAQKLPSSRRSLTLPERHQRFLGPQDLNEMIRALSIAYNQTGNEYVLDVLNKLREHRQQIREDQWQLEELFREDEINEFWENPGKYPFSVRVWFMMYREKENEL